MRENDADGFKVLADQTTFKQSGNSKIILLTDILFIVYSFFIFIPAVTLHTFKKKTLCAQ